MNLSPAQKITFKTEIANRLSPKSWSQIDLILSEFGIFTEDNWSGDKFDYVISMMSNVTNEILFDLAGYLHVESGDNSVLDMPKFWNEGDLCVFISHLAKNKQFASEMQDQFRKYGISGFVAHEDIIPNSEWQEEIEKALQTCDALPAILHDGFKDSDWTEQEIGYALGRGVPVFSIRIGMDPYGLFGKKQAFNGNGKSAYVLTRELVDAYIVHPRTQKKFSDVIIRKFCKSKKFSESKEFIEFVEKIDNWNTEYSQELLDAKENNTQISDSWGVPDKIISIIEKKDPGFVKKNEDTEGDDIPF